MNIAAKAPLSWSLASIAGLGVTAFVIGWWGTTPTTLISSSWGLFTATTYVLLRHPHGWLWMRAIWVTLSLGLATTVTIVMLYAPSLRFVAATAVAGLGVLPLLVRGVVESLIAISSSALPRLREPALPEAIMTVLPSLPHRIAEVQEAMRYPLHSSTNLHRIATIASGHFAVSGLVRMVEFSVAAYAACVTRRFVATRYRPYVPLTVADCAVLCAVSAAIIFVWAVE